MSLWYESATQPSKLYQMADRTTVTTTTTMISVTATTATTATATATSTAAPVWITLWTNAQRTCAVDFNLYTDANATNEAACKSSCEAYVNCKAAFLITATNQEKCLLFSDCSKNRVEWKFGHTYYLQTGQAPSWLAMGSWLLGANINPCDGNNFGYAGPWEGNNNVGSLDTFFSEDFLNKTNWKRVIGYVAIARHVNGICEMAKTWELTDKTQSMSDYFSTYPGRLTVTGDGSINDQHIHADIPDSATGLTQDPIFGAEGGLVFNWVYSNNGARIAVPGGYINPYSLPGNSNTDDLHGLGNELGAATSVGSGSSGWWHDAAPLQEDCDATSCLVLGTDHGTSLSDGDCWGGVGYSIYLSKEATSLQCQGRALSLEMAPEEAWQMHEYITMNPSEQDRTYSSVYGNAASGTGHAQSMLDSAQSWSPLESAVGEWMQIDLGDSCPVIGTVVQGRHDPDVYFNQWVTSYQVTHSRDGVTWSDVETWSEVVGVFPGNSDSSTEVKAWFPSSVDARYVRLVPQTWHDHISMRAGVLRALQGWTQSGISVTSSTATPCCGTSMSSLLDGNILTHFGIADGTTAGKMYLDIGPMRTITQFRYTADGDHANPRDIRFLCTDVGPDTDTGAILYASVSASQTGSTTSTTFQATERYCILEWLTNHGSSWLVSLAEL
jgi:hypothetical protein